MADNDTQNGKGKQAPGDKAAQDEAARMEQEQRDRLAREQATQDQRTRDEAARREAEQAAQRQGGQGGQAEGAMPATGGAPAAALGAAAEPLAAEHPDPDHAEEMERRRVYDAERARRQAAGGVSVMVAHALAAGMTQEQIDAELDAAFASRTPRTLLTGAVGTGQPGLGVERTVGPNEAHLPPTPLAGGVNGPSPRAASAMPATAGQVVRSTDPRFKGQRLVQMTFVAPLTLTMDDQSQISFRPGTQPVPESLVGHWYLQAAGARPLDEAA